MFIVESQAKKLQCPFLGGKCIGRDCTAWKPVREGDGQHPAFQMTSCFGFYWQENNETDCSGGCSKCEYCPGRCIRLHPVDPYEAKLKRR